MHCLHKPLPYLIFGVLFGYVIPLSSLLQVSPVTCGGKNISSCCGHCVTSQEGVSELDCFGKHLSLSMISWKCVWTPIKHQTQRYTLCIEQKTHCKIHENISETSQTIVLSKKFNMTAHVFDKSDLKSCTKTVFRGSPQQLDLYGKLNLTFNGNTSFTVSWVDDLIKTYSCFSVEWWTRGIKAAHKSFYEDENNYEVIPLREPLELYKRYTFTLHTRPDKETCNLKFINNSESTYGSIQSYFTEGSPISAPGNISSSNVTQSSMVLEWTSVPEKDTRGFLLGYILHYTKSPDDRIDVEKNVTVDAGSTSYELVDLQSNTVYQVQLSAFTAAGMGVRSSAVYFETKSTVSQSIGGMIAGVVIGATLLLLVVNLGSLLLKRAKRLLWPSIPNPGNSNAIQKIDGVCELELLEPINKQKLEEEGDANSLHIVDSREEKSPFSNLHSNTDSCLHLNTEHEENQGPSKTTADSTEPTKVDPQINVGLCRRNTATDSSAQDPTSDTIKPTIDTRQTDPVPISAVAHQCPQLSFMSDYTTMELFQQAMTQCVPATITLEPHGQSSQSEYTDSPLTRPESDYIHQSLYDTVLHLSQGSTSPTEVYYTVL
uniref:Interleukin-31 receptor subunit alpha n=1 Tax=Oncorhynchus kisutch TaxID=8019 RepID=A0A8C7LCU8_ONCKI